MLYLVTHLGKVSRLSAYLYFQGPYRVILIDYFCYQLALIKRIFTVWWCNSIDNFFVMCVCV
jgi:hypothetical protein